MLVPYWVLTLQSVYHCAIRERYSLCDRVDRFNLRRIRSSWLAEGHRSQYPRELNHAINVNTLPRMSQYYIVPRLVINNS